MYHCFPLTYNLPLTTLVLVSLGLLRFDFLPAAEFEILPPSSIVSSLEETEMSNSIIWESLRLERLSPFAPEGVYNLLPDPAENGLALSFFVATRNKH